MFCPAFREEWKVISNPRVRSGMYSISNAGRVMNNITGQVLRQGMINSGYLVVSLRTNEQIGRGAAKFLIHRLVAEEFVPNDIPQRNTVNHKDGCKLLDHWYNLEWNTQSENNMHAKITGMNKGIGETHYAAKFTNEQVVKICELLQAGYSYKDILDIIGLDSSNASNNNNYDLIGNIKRGIAWNSISKDYDFSARDIRKTIRGYSIDQVKQICSLIEQGLDGKEALPIVTGQYYSGYKENRHFLDLYSDIKNKKVATDISGKYRF